MAIQKYKPDDFEVDVGIWHPSKLCQLWNPREQYDLILQLVPDHKKLRRYLVDDTLIVGGLNVGYGRHAERLMLCRNADHTVINNRELWERLNRPANTSWISNGVDLDDFGVDVPPADRQPKILWAGCTYHCSGPEDVKGWRVLAELGAILTREKIKYDFRQTDASNPREMLDTKAMRDWYNTGTIYVCASSSEGTPNPALEAAACGCVVVSTRVGNMPELIDQYRNGELVDRRAQDIWEAVYRCGRDYPMMGSLMEADILRLWSWERKAEVYYELFRELIDANSRPIEGR